MFDQVLRSPRAPVVHQAVCEWNLPVVDPAPKAVRGLLRCRCAAARLGPLIDSPFRHEQYSLLARNHGCGSECQSVSISTSRTARCQRSSPRNPRGVARRDGLIPQHGIRLVAITPADLDATPAGRLRRNEDHDLPAIRSILRPER
jgi:hypothetical protein